MTSKRIVFTKPNTAELLDYELADPKENEIQVALAVSTISSGTERANIMGSKTVAWNRPEAAEAIFPRYNGYSSAGIVRPDTLEDGLAAMITTSTGYTLISEYYDTPLMSQNMISERKRIVSLLLDSNHKGLLDKFLS